MNHAHPFARTWTFLSTLLLLGASLLFALPPLEVEVSEPRTLDVSWPDTGETVQLETSVDLDFWQTLPGAPSIDDGRFRQTVPIDGMGGYFRLTETTADPNAPVYGGLPETTPIFPGETISFTLAATDPNGLPVRYLAEPLPLPTGATLDPETGEFAWKPSVEQIGTTGITFLAYNGTVSGRLPISFNVEAPPADGETSLTGILLDTTNAVGGEQQPISGATVSLLGTGRSTVSGADGRFLLEDIPGELQILDIDTSEADPAPDGSPYAGFREALVIVEGIANDITRPLYLPRIATDSLKKVLPNFTTKVENVATGTSLTVPPHTAVLGDEEFDGELSISEVPEALAPAALPPYLGFGQLVTIQPVGVRFTNPVPITFKNVDNLPPESETDIWSLDPDAGVFTVVGTGKVTPDGEFIETVKGGVIAADWHGTLPPGIGPGNGPGGSGPGSPSPPGSGPPSGGPGTGDGGGDGPGDDGEGGPDDGTGNDGDPPGCPGDSNGGASGPFGSSVLLADGAVVTTVSTPSYLSGGRQRSVTLAYHSLTACPRVVVPLELTVPVQSAVPRQISFEGVLGGLSGGPPIFVDTSGLSESVDETFSAGISFDARGLATGFAPYTIRATSHFARSTVTADTTDRAIVLNRSQSAFGAGWGILGDQRIVSARDDDSAQLLIHGDGSYKLFRDAATFAPFTLASLGGSRASTYAFADSDLFSQARAAISDDYPAAAFQSVEGLGQASEADLLVLTPYASATEGAPLSGADQSALSAFVRSGGCAIVFLDHDLGRASFSAAIDSLLEPFGLSGTNTTISEAAIPASAHALIDGDGGTVSELDLPFGGHEVTDPSNRLEIIVPGTTAGSALLSVLPKGALGADSGPVIFVADTQAFIDSDAFGIESSPSHSALLLNTIAFCLRSQREPGDDLEFIGPPGEFSQLLRRPNGAFERRMPNGTVFNFNASGRLVSSRERHGETASFEYDSIGNLTKITDSFSQVTSLSYTNGRLANVIDPAGRNTAFQVDTAGNLTRVQFPDGSSARYEYDVDHLMTAEIDASGARTERVYDASGRVTTARLPDGTERTVQSIQGLAADLGGTAGSESDPAPIKRPEDMVARYTNAAGETHQVEIGPLGTGTQITDSAGRVRETVRSESGKPVQVTLPTGRQFSAQYNRQGRRTALTDGATGTTLTMEYDGTFGTIRALSNGVGQSALFELDANGRAESFTSFAGRQTTFTYDGLGTLPASVIDPSGLERLFSYDAQGNPEEIRAADTVTSLGYTAAGQLETLTDAEGRVYQFEYDIVGNLSRSEFPGDIAIAYAHDERGLKTIITPPSGAAHQFTYDGRGRLRSFASPLGNAFRMNFEYANGRLARKQWGDGSEVRYGFLDGRFTSLTTPDGPTSFTYGETTGLLARITAPGNHQLDYTYDAAGRLVDSQWTGAVNGKVSRTYDSLSRVASLTVNDATSLAMTYDPDDYLTRVGAMTVTRDAATGLISATSLGKCSDSWTYNAFGELTAYTANYDGNAIYRLTLTRDKLGRIRTKEETIQGTSTTTNYLYGDAGRLVQEVRAGVTINYTYDANGNRLSRTESGGATESGTYNAGDQLTSYAGTNYRYDDRGRLSMRGADTFDYGVLGDLQSVSLSGGTTLTYQDPAGGRRTSESINGTVNRQFVYQDALTIVAELDGTGAVRSVFGHATLRGAPDFIQRSDATFRIFKDDLGSPRLVINCETGAIAQVMRHDAFGRVLEDSAPRFQPFGFAGGLYDTDTGFLRFGARDYDPFTGRWTAPDPSLFNGSLFNLYAYTSNDPVNFIDRNGLAEESSSAAAEGSCSFPSQCVSGEFDALAGEVMGAALEQLGSRGMTMDGSIFVNDGFGAGPESQALHAHEQVHAAGSSGGCASPNSSTDAEEAAARAVENMVLKRTIVRSVKP